MFYVYAYTLVYAICFIYYVIYATYQILHIIYFCMVYCIYMHAYCGFAQYM